MVKIKLFFKTDYAILIQHVNLHIIKRKNRVGHWIDQKILSYLLYKEKSKN
jgi:hypothetical protein